MRSGIDTNTLTVSWRRGDREPSLSDSEREALTSSSGFVVEASDGRVGEIELPIFPPDLSEPDYLLLRPEGLLSLRRPLVATELIDQVDVRGRRICVRGSRAQIESLPYRVPLAI
jgi:hypothetical protein